MISESRNQTGQLSKEQFPVAVQDLCYELSRTGQIYLRQISAFSDVIVPNRGDVVYFHMNKIAGQLNGLESMVVYSAIDVCTNLQVAQIHFVSTVGGALSFVDFVVRCFPFALKQIKTVRESPFSCSEGRNDRHDFSAMIAERGISHTSVSDTSADALYSITSSLLFSKISDGTHAQASAAVHYRSLAQFLLYHNNYRSIAWLNGNTPLQKLKSFVGYASVHSFSLPEDLPAQHSVPEIRAAEGFARQLSVREQ